MTVYAIAQLKFTDEAVYRRYQAAFPEVLARFNAAVMVADEAPKVREGDWPLNKLVILRFPDAAEAGRFAEDAGYSAIACDRRAGADGIVVRVRGTG